LKALRRGTLFAFSQLMMQVRRAGQLPLIFVLLFSSRLFASPDNFQEAITRIKSISTSEQFEEYLEKEDEGVEIALNQRITDTDANDASKMQALLDLGEFLKAKFQKMVEVDASPTFIYIPLPKSIQTLLITAHGPDKFVAVTAERVVRNLSEMYAEYVPGKWGSYAISMMARLPFDSAAQKLHKVAEIPSEHNHIADAVGRELSKSFMEILESALPRTHDFINFEFPDVTLNKQERLALQVELRRSICRFIASRLGRSEISSDEPANNQ
jgi:hypothetical protein